VWRRADAEKSFGMTEEESSKLLPPKADVSQRKVAQGGAKVDVYFTGKVCVYNTREGEMSRAHAPTLTVLLDACCPASWQGKGIASSLKPPTDSCLQRVRARETERRIERERF
jgi:hypothetical protein